LFKTGLVQPTLLERLSNSQPYYISGDVVGLLWVELVCLEIKTMEELVDFRCTGTQLLHVMRM